MTLVHMEGLQLSSPQDRKLILGVQVLAVGTAAVGLATGALALDERTRKHFAQSAETADEATAQLQFRIAGHKCLLVTDGNNSVRTEPCQDPLKICKNGLVRKRGDKL